MLKQINKNSNYQVDYITHTIDIEISFKTFFTNTQQHQCIIYSNSYMIEMADIVLYSLDRNLASGAGFSGMMPKNNRIQSRNQLL